MTLIGKDIKTGDDVELVIIFYGKTLKNLEMICKIAFLNI